MNSNYHLIINSIATIFFFYFSPTLNIITIHPILVCLIPIVVISGVFFPDIDKRIPGLQHRSFLTHSAIIGFLVFIPRIYQGSEASFLLNIFCFGVGVHLICDLKITNKMTGTATIKMPDGVKKQIRQKKYKESKFSFSWLLLNSITLIIISIVFI